MIQQINSSSRSLGLRLGIRLKISVAEYGMEEMAAVV
jgi:hypothetical protein